MFCTNCGAQVPDGVAYCTSCGAPLAASGGEKPADARTVPEAPRTAPEPVPGAPEPRPARRRGLVAVIVVAVLVIVASAGAAAWLLLSRPSLTSVTLAIGAEGLDSASGTTIPVRVAGTTAAGEDCAQDVQVASGGTAVELTDGAYEISVTASPIAADGTIYDVEHAGTATLTVGDGAATIDGSINLEPIPADEVTDEQIEAAYQAALAGSAADEQTAEALRDAALARRDEAVAQQGDGGAASSGEPAGGSDGTDAGGDSADEQRSFSTSAFSFDIPDAWVGRVRVEVDGANATVYAADFPSRALVTLRYVPSSADMGTDMSGVVFRTGDLGGGMVVMGYADDWAYVFASSELGGTAARGGAPAAGEAEELTELQSLGAVSYADVLESMRGTGYVNPDPAVLAATAAGIVPESFNIRAL